MAGKIKQLIDHIVTVRAMGNPTIAHTTRIKLLLKGIDPRKYTELTEDDAETLAAIKQVAAELGVRVDGF